MAGLHQPAGVAVISETTGRHPLVDLLAGVGLAGLAAQVSNQFADRMWPDWLPGQAQAGGLVAAGLAMFGARFTRGGVSEGFTLAAFLLGGSMAVNGLVGALPPPPVDGQGRAVLAGASSNLEELLGGRVSRAVGSREVAP